MLDIVVIEDPATAVVALDPIRAGGTCVVRVIMTGFGTGDTWDEELKGMTVGMRAALESLRTHLTHATTV